MGIDWMAAAYVFALPPATIAGIIAYSCFHGVHPFEPALCAVMFYVTGMGVTAGYHRYYAHRSHEAHPIVQIFYLIAGATMVQRAVLDWSHVHRAHHRYADTDLDPHNIKQGFFYAHMGWIYQKTALLNNYSLAPDLIKDKLVQWQKKYYWWIVLVFGVGLAAGIGWLYGRPLGGILWGFALKVVLQSHSAYSINSWAHTIGRQTFSKRQEARDSFWLALISNGEGYHSFHHRFPNDYRNGVRWHDWDPSKWFVGFLSWFGLTKNLKRASALDIRNAKIKA